MYLFLLTFTLRKEFYYVCIMNNYIKIVHVIYKYNFQTNFNFAYKILQFKFIYFYIYIYINTI